MPLAHDTASFPASLPTREGERCEFKSSFNLPVIESLVAFANTSGGSVWVGVDDGGHPVPGFAIGAETVVGWVNEIRNKTQPALIPEVEVYDVDGRSVVCFSTSEFPVKPVSCRGKYFKRVSNSNHQMALNEIANLHLRTVNLSWDFYPDHHHTLADLSLDKVNAFIGRAGSLRRTEISDDPLTVLRKYELLREDGITFGCFLLFCAQPSLISTIEAGRFDSETIIRDSVSIKDDLFSEIDACMEFIQKHISKRYVITGKPQRDEVWEYPLEAIREIVVNMIVHRDYQATADSTIKIHSDRIEFFNPGPLADGITIKSILTGKSPSHPRNKLMASVFKEAGVIEKYGSGIKRVRHVLQSAGAPPPRFESLPDFFKVTLYPILAEGAQSRGGVNGGVNGGVTEGVNGGVTEGARSLRLAIEQEPGNRLPFYADKLSVPVKTAEHWLKTLRDTKTVVFTGAPKTGGYTLSGEIPGGVERDEMSRKLSATGEQSGGVSEGVNGGVTEGVRSLRLAIEQEPGNRLPFYADKLGVPVKSAERWLKTLRDNKTVVFAGAPKTGGYHIAPTG